MPVQAMVMMLDCSIVPQLTITGGIGPSKVPPFHCIFFIKTSILQK
jgi:hypothetical protein